VPGDRAVPLTPPDPAVAGQSARSLAAWPLRADTREHCTCTLHSPSPAVMARPGNGAGMRRAAEGFLPPLFAVRGAYAAGWLSSRVRSLVGVLRAVRSSAARTAIAAGSSMRSGRPCLSRERRASCAPALRISARSSGLSGWRGGRRTGCLPVRLALAFFRPGLAGVLSVVGHHLPETTRRSGHHLRSAARKGGWGGCDTHRAEPGAISRCNQILTVCSEQWAHGG
jgi:hypothetical protein